MRNQQKSIAGKLILAGCLAIGLSAAAQARDLSSAQEAQIQHGMSQADVQQVLGKADHVERYALNKETAWQYELRDQVVRPGDKVFEVTFDANGRVVGASDRWLQNDD